MTTKEGEKASPFVEVQGFGGLWAGKSENLKNIKG